MHDIEILERRLDSRDAEDADTTTELTEKKAAIEEINNQRANGAYIRSRAMYKVDGEKPTKMFCELEKYNGIQKFVPQLIVEEENSSNVNTISDQKGVEKEIHDYYEKLYR